MNTISSADFSDVDVLEFLAEQESQDIRSVDYWRDALKDALANPTGINGIKLPWPKTHSTVRLRGGEVSVWVGSNGHFKSTLVNQAALYATTDVSCGIMSFEMPAPVTLERMCKQASATSNPPPEYADRFIDALSGRMWIYDHLDTIEPERALACAHYMMGTLGIKLVVLDCLIMVRGISRDAEREADFMGKLAALAKVHDAHIALVHHIRKPASGGDEYIPTRWDIRGASDIADMASTIFICWNNKAKATALRKQSVGATLTEKESEALEKPCQLLIVAKQRNAEFEGTIGLNLNRGAMQFRESDRQRLWLESVA